MTDHKPKLIDLLQDALAFESMLQNLVTEHIKACQDGPSRRLYREHARLTMKQKRRLAERLESLGENPTGSAGCFTQRLRRLALEVAVMDVWRDESTQRLITSYGIKQVECGLYRSLLDLADSVDDEATSGLARLCLEEEEAITRRLLFCIGLATRGKAA